MNAWTAQFWPGFVEGGSSVPKTLSVSSYGNSHPREDMAESAREYFEHGASMKQKDPERYAFIKDKVMGGKEYLN